MRTLRVFSWASLGAIAWLGLATAGATAYLLAAGVVVFAHNDRDLLPGSRLLAEPLQFASPFRSLW